MNLTLGTLLDHHELGLEPVVACDGGRSRPVAGAHSIEIADPVRFLRPNWIMLTNGVRLKNQPNEQRRLVADLQAGGMAALGFGLGEFFHRMPTALVEEAEARGFPTFAIRRPIPFREIITFVNQATLNHNVYHLRRAVAIQNDLLESLVGTRPEQAAVERLAMLLGGAAVTLLPSGAVEYQSGEPPSVAIWREIQRGGRTLRDFRLGDAAIIAVPIISDGGLRRWLAFCHAGDEETAQIARRVLQTAQRLLDLVETGRRSSRVEEHMVQADTLLGLLARSSGSAFEAACRRLERFGFSAGAPSRVAVMVGPAVGTAPTAEVTERVRDRLDWAGATYLLARYHGTLAALIEGEQLDLDSFALGLADEGLPLRIAVGRAVRDPREVTLSHGDAMFGQAELARTNRLPAVLSFEDLGLADALLSAAHELADTRAAQMLAPLRIQGDLYETLLVYLDEDLDVGSAAARLHLHPNSLRYRLSRIEAVLGRSLRSVATIADLHLAVTVTRAGEPSSPR